jgi:hypothetical protein
VHKRCKISVIRPGKKFIDAAAKKLYCILEKLLQGCGSDKKKARSNLNQVSVVDLNLKVLAGS